MPEQPKKLANVLPVANPEGHSDAKLIVSAVWFYKWLYEGEENVSVTTSPA
jgi:hypothetical protein